MESSVMPWAFIGAGIFSMVGAVKDWEWFMNWRNGRWLLSLLGRNGARAVYFLSGLAVACVGLALVLGVIE